MVLGKLDRYMQKNEIRTLASYTKIKLKMDERPTCKTGCYKTLRGNIGQTLPDINHSNIFSDPPPGVMTIKTKINKWDLMFKFINFFFFFLHSKGNPK